MAKAPLSAVDGQIRINRLNLLGKQCFYLSLAVLNPTVVNHSFNNNSTTPNNNTSLNANIESSTSSSSEYGGGARSSGDGGSSIHAEESNYATLTKINEFRGDEEEEDSHYSLIRKPDGQADDSKYPMTRESDGGYESLHNNVTSPLCFLRNWLP